MATAATGAAVFSTLNAGKTAPGKADYAEYQGASMAAPHVAGMALMKAVDPKLTLRSGEEGSTVHLSGY